MFFTFDQNYSQITISTFKVVRVFHSLLDHLTPLPTMGSKSFLLKFLLLYLSR